MQVLDVRVGIGTWEGSERRKTLGREMKERSDDGVGVGWTGHN